MNRKRTNFIDPLRKEAFRPHTPRHSRKASSPAAAGSRAVSSFPRGWLTPMLLALLLLTGMAVGAVFIRHGDSSLLRQLDFLFFSNFQERAQQPFLLLFAASFASSFLFVLACFLCGLSMWGMLFIPAVLVFRGFGLGITGGHLLAAYGMQGFLFYASVLLPGAFLCFLGLVLAAQEGAKLSKGLLAGSTPTKLYFMHFGVILGMEFFASLLDAVTAACFSGFFSF